MRMKNKQLFLVNLQLLHVKIKLISIVYIDYNLIKSFPLALYMSYLFVTYNVHLLNHLLLIRLSILHFLSLAFSIHILVGHFNFFMIRNNFCLLIITCFYFCSNNSHIFFIHLIIQQQSFLFMIFRIYKNYYLIKILILNLHNFPYYLIYFNFHLI